MPRIKLIPPQNILATVSIPVRISDINYGNHVGNDSFVSLIHEARVQWLRQHGYTELNIEGVVLLQADLAVEFKNEGFYGDEVTIQISAGDVSKMSFELYYTLTTTRQGKTIVLALAKTGMVCFNASERKITVVPTRLGEILSGGSKALPPNLN
jgi:acyl-CoA thioester hydrolase